MCDCVTMCWIFDQITENGRFPVPNHHPKCEDYKAKRYIRLFDPDSGDGFIDTCENQYGYMSSDEFDSMNLRQEDVVLTEDQFLKLKEFTGF